MTIHEPQATEAGEALTDPRRDRRPPAGRRGGPL